MFHQHTLEILYIAFLYQMLDLYWASCIIINLLFVLSSFFFIYEWGGGHAFTTRGAPPLFGFDSWGSGSCSAPVHLRGIAVEVWLRDSSSCNPLPQPSRLFPDPCEPSPTAIKTLRKLSAVCFILSDINKYIKLLSYICIGLWFM